MKRPLLVAVSAVLLTVACQDVRQPVPSGPTVVAQTTLPTLSFTNTPLLRPDGNSEPEIAIAANGAMGMVGLSLGLAPDRQFGTSLWTGPFGATPTFQGIIDAALQQPGRIEFGGEDADVDFGSTGALHLTTLLFLGNQTLRTGQLGVSAISCPNAAAGFSAATCRSQIIDLTESDRPWITSDGSRVFISYHDAGNSTLIHVQRSDDDGLTWRRVGDPIVGQGQITGQSTFNNDQGNLAADPLSHTVYDIYAAGEVGILKAKTTDFDHIYVSRSTDGGLSWTTALVFHAATPVGLNNVFPTVAVEPTNGTVHAAWSDGHTVSYSTSSDHGVTWSPAVTVNVAPASTALFPWLAARDGVVDLAYYGTTASSKDDLTAVWNVYLAQAVNGGAFQQSRVSNTPNHVGVICTRGVACARGTRNLLDLFQVALDPGSDKAAVIYTDDTINQTSSGAPLPQVVLAQQQ
ncbi:MAG TPA: sialidase family protein [Gemmatimonadales bacterium]|nr:sialidase family protein [Gemmatimonadales bacterium]